MRQLWALVHAASACEKSLISVATRGRSAEGSEIAISFIYVSNHNENLFKLLQQAADDDVSWATEGDRLAIPLNTTSSVPVARMTSHQ